MAIQDDNTILNKGDLKAYHEAIAPLLGGTFMVRTNNSDFYSTDEKVVGVWTDGRPVYQKTIRLANQNATTFTYAHGIPNIDYASIVPAASCVDSHSYNDIKQGLPYYISSTDWIFIRVIGANLSINKGSASNWYVNNADLIVTLQYTKTTDSANAALTTPGAYDINFPNTWQKNKEIYFGNGVYGQRFTGNTPAVSTDSYSTVTLKPSGTFADSFKMVNSGGSLTILNASNEKVNINLNASHNTSSSVLRASTDIFKTGIGALTLGIYMGDWHTTTSSTYDVWITYTK